MSNGFVRKTMSFSGWFAKRIDSNALRSKRKISEYAEGNLFYLLNRVEEGRRTLLRCYDINSDYSLLLDFFSVWFTVRHDSLVTDSFSRTSARNQYSPDFNNFTELLDALKRHEAFSLEVGIEDLENVDIFENLFLNCMDGEWQTRLWVDYVFYQIELGIPLGYNNLNDIYNFFFKELPPYLEESF